MPPRMDPGGSSGGGVVTADARELRTLASSANNARQEVEDVQRSAAGIIGGLDGRGWNIGAVTGKWAGVRGQMTSLTGTLAIQALDLQTRALWVEAFENGGSFGGAPGTPLQDPVNSATGNLVHTEDDFALPSRGGLRLGLSRTYNSRDSSTSAFGPGWSSTVDCCVDNCGDIGAVVRRATGRRDAFVLNDDGGYDPPIGVRDSLVHERGGWRLSAPDGVVHHFGSDGRIESIDVRGQGGIVFERDDQQRVVRIVDRVGRALTLDYHADLLVKATDCAGRTYRYDYSDTALLLAAIDPAGAATRYAYDANGRLATITDPVGRVALANAYDDLGRVVEQRNGAGAVSHIAYAGPDLAWQITTLSDPLGHTVQLKHEQHGLVTEIVDALGQSEAYTYTECGNRATITDRSGQTWTYEYNGQCRVAAMVTPTGGVTRFEYNSAGDLVQRTDELGATWSFEYDDRRNLVAIITPLGAATRIERDESGQAVRVTDADSVTAVYEYDEAGNVTRFRTAAGQTKLEYDAAGRRLAVIEANGSTSRWEYDPLGRATLFHDALGGVTAWQYDAAGQLVEQIDATGARARCAYDDAGRIALIVDQLGGEVRFGYDANGNLVELTDPAGYSGRMAYDALDRLREIVDPCGGVWRREFDPEGRLIAAIDARGGIARRVYDAAGMLVELRDRVGGSTHFTHDARGYVVATTDPSGTETRYAYDADGRPTSRTNALGARTALEWTPAGRLSAIVDPHGHRAELEYDAAGRRVRIVYPDHSEATFTYDAVGNLVKWTEPTGASRTLTHDLLHRLTRDTDALGRTAELEYDARGKVVAYRDSADAVTHFEYDALGNLLSVIDALNGTTRYTYEPRGLLSGVTDANGHSRSFESDGNGLPVGSTDALSQRTRFVNDACGNLVGWEDPSGHRGSMEYDAENRPIRMQTSDGQEVRAAYDAAGRWTTLQNALGAHRRVYDAVGQVIRATDPLERITEYAYDVAGLRTRLIYPGGTECSFAYDHADRPSAVHDSGIGTTRLRYAPGGVPAGIELPNGASWESTRDLMGRVTELRELDASGSVVSSFRYTYDRRNNILSADEGGARTSYAYDDLNRLIGVNGETRFEYDAVSNRLVSRLADSREVHATFDAADQLVSLDGASQYRYDARGNLVKRIDSVGGITTYAWDDMDRLVGLESGNITRTFEYDPFGTLMRERRGEATREFAYDTTAPIAALLLAADGQSTTRFVYGLQRVAHVEQRSDGDAVFPRTDIRGSLRAIEDSTGRTLARREYDAWGDALEHDNADLLGFTGEPHDTDTGLVYLRARWYEPSTGRMLGRDPVPGTVRDPLTQNAYAYARANPVSLVDPTGRSAAGTFPGTWNFPTNSSIPVSAPFGPLGPFGGLPGIPGEGGGSPFAPTPYDPFSSAISGSTAAADAWMKRVEDLYNQAKHASNTGKTALRDWLRYDQMMREALDPNEARAYARAVDSYADDARNAFKDASRLRNEAGALDDAFPGARKIAGIGKVGGPALDFGTSALDEYEDTGGSTGNRLRHAGIKGAATAAGSYGGAALLGGACAASGVGTALTFGCGAVGGFVGGKLGGLAGDVINSIF